MMSLAETQSLMRASIIGDPQGGALPLLVGGADPLQRLAIHRRHYQASLVGALMTKFPATAWLMGEAFVAAAAEDYVRRYPPASPCIAEYGEGFPRELARRPGADRLPCLYDFAVLEWRVGHVSVAISHPPADLTLLAQCDPATLPNVVLRLQPGVRYLSAEWPVDDLIGLYLRGNAPDRFTIEPAKTFIEIRGARGEFRIERLDAASFTFRQAIAEGRSIGDAAELATVHDDAFDPGRALRDIAADELIDAVIIPSGPDP